MSLTYSTTVSSLATLTAIPSTNADFQGILPDAIDYAEQRLYRELDPILENVSDSSGATSPGSRNFALPTALGKFQIIDEVTIITPASTAAESGTRNTLVPVSRTVLDWTWPSVAGATVPTQWAYFSQANLTGDPALASQTNIIFGPWPDDAYTVEIIGKIIPIPLTEANTTTFLTLYYPDLFLMACQIYFDNFMKNFGRLSDDPQAAVTHESQFQLLLASAKNWEARKRFSGASWTANSVEPTAVSQRG